MKTSTLLAFGALLTTSVLALPSPQESSAPTTVSSSAISTATEDINPANPTWQELDFPMLIFSPKGNFSIMSRLTGFRGCGDRNGIIMQAFTDALKIVGSVGNPVYITGRAPGDNTPKGQEVYDYWGPESNWKHVIMSGNYKRAQLTGDQTWIGDYWWDRYFEITCDDPLNRYYPPEPKAGWTKGIAIAGEDEEPVIDGDTSDAEEDVATTDDLLSDDELYPAGFVAQ